MSGSGSSGDDTPAWMVYDGAHLVPFNPPSMPPPLPEDPLALPSPFYYAHVSPQMYNPIYRLRMPRISSVGPISVDDAAGNVRRGGRREARMKLDTVPIPVNSPHSAKGRAMVRTVVWTARVPSAFPFHPHSNAAMNHPRSKSFPDMGLSAQLPLEVGSGWRCDWVLQGPGTKEGRDMLIDILEGRADSKTWEAVRERSTGGKLWLRCLDST
jgi:hypothetical protein